MNMILSLLTLYIICYAQCTFTEHEDAWIMGNSKMVVTVSKLTGEINTIELQGKNIVI